ncbi:hypothetical protein F5972_04740 [Microbispora cellulosiformans]|uniref:Uncharacterized protein n=1 Tax=Microbispora cellulosiformans TaxID=2614688 RepID=A0A5J5K8V3_9ACTN|nr:hypothetical protein [Microbispora cellulosiformans]KAA9380467.1 hypothetical protein F5972_04740 [Microbispora cellulosiformans]
MRPLVRLILTAVVVMVTTAGSAADGPRLYLNSSPYTDDEVSIGVALPDVVAHRPYSLGGWVMCVDGPGAAVIDRIDLINPSGGIVLQAFSFRRRGDHPMLGNAERPLTELGFPARGSAVTTVCAKNGESLGTELGLQYGKTGEVTAHAEGVRVHYTSAGRRRTVDFALDVRLCAPGDMSTEQCREMYESDE